VTVALALDLLLMIAVLAVAFRALHAQVFFNAVVLYIAFGLLMALVWVRLEAPDLALAEAAIGAGITGALLLDAAGQLGTERRDPGRRFGSLALAAVLVGVGGILVGALVPLGGRTPGLRAPILGSLEEAGVSHAVTAVLLNYRAYDTWLEVGVLLVAALGVIALRRGEALGQSPSREPGGVAEATTSRLVPFALLIGGYLLWRGTSAPGGAFQAGAVIAAAGIVLVLTRGTAVDHVYGRSLPVRLLLLVGFAAFLLAAVLGMLGGGAMLEYPAAHAGSIILLVEIAVAVSIASTLLLLFAAGRWESASMKGESL
jgi:multisubunit Na+/H+ antiporter MnhB subunit